MQLKRIRKELGPAWEQFRVRVSKAPKEFWVIGGMCLLVALLVGLHLAFAQKNAILRVRVQHSFRSAQITVSVDGDTVYSGKLTGAIHKKFGLLPEGIQGSWSQGIPVTAGQHRISVRVVGDDGSDRVDNTAAKFVSGGEREVLVIARHSDLSANWTGITNSLSAVPAATFPEPQPSWFNRYASALFLTIAGSIVSAISGYAIREIPARLRSRTAGDKAPASRAAAAGR
jgi:hypothetical protein